MHILEALQSNSLPTKQFILAKVDRRADTRDVETCLDQILRGAENGDEDDEYEDEYEDESDDGEGSSATPECANDYAFQRVRDVLGIPRFGPF